MATEILLPVRPVSFGLHERRVAEADIAGAEPLQGGTAKILHFPFEPDSSGCIRGWMIAAGMQGVLLGAAFIVWEIWRFVR
jgi:hypothetical protein